MLQILDGRALGRTMAAALAPRIAHLRTRAGRPPGLAVVLVGDDGPSQIYVRNKARAAAAAGVNSQVVRLPGDAAQAAVLRAVEALNLDPRIDGMLVQLPLPVHLDAAAITGRIAPGKDADGLLPASLGLLMAGRPGPRPCTPAGIMALLAQAGLPLRGAQALVVGRSAIVGRPLALMLLQADATVTVCHSHSRDLPALVRAAEVLVVAVGSPNLIAGDWVRPGAVVIDVGINRTAAGLCGDVDFAGAQAHARAITPVPGGVGPMTIAMLLENTVALAELAWDLA